jgi:hypothetical protein
MFVLKLIKDVRYIEINIRGVWPKMIDVQNHFLSSSELLVKPQFIGIFYKHIDQYGEAAII